VRGRNGIDRIVAHVIADAREAAVAAITDAFTDPNLHDRIAQLIRDELDERTRDLVEQVFRERAEG
jgi:hypothetical protein